MARRWLGCLVLLLYLPCPGYSQEVPHTSQGMDLQRPVAFHFTNSSLTTVLHTVAQLTGWSVVYHPTQVPDTVTIITPGDIPLAQALRLVYTVTQPYGQAIQVLMPSASRPIPLTTALATLLQPPERRDVVIWNSANAHDPQTSLTPCDPSGNSQYPIPGINVIVDERR